ncbi:hypothetical protein D3C72_2469950 [compost metagenome]
MLVVERKIQPPVEAWLLFVLHSILSFPSKMPSTLIGVTVASSRVRLKLAGSVPVKLLPVPPVVVA